MYILLTNVNVIDNAPPFSEKGGTISSGVQPPPPRQFLGSVPIYFALPVSIDIVVVFPAPL